MAKYGPRHTSNWPSKEQNLGIQSNNRHAQAAQHNRRRSTLLARPADHLLVRRPSAAAVASVSGLLLPASAFLLGPLGVGRPLGLAPLLRGSAIGENNLVLRCSCCWLQTAC
jgi:hypothetical protein